jgi:hypothetical protein
MFGLSKKPQAPEQNFWMLKMHIGRGSNTEMPAELAGAFVPVFVSAQDHEAAARAAVGEIRRRGYEFIDIQDQKIHQLEPRKWTSFVEKSWPEFAPHFPNQDQVIAGLSTGKIFFGPFAGYEAQDVQPGVQADRP